MKIIEKILAPYIAPLKAELTSLKQELAIYKAKMNNYETIQNKNLQEQIEKTSERINQEIMDRAFVDALRKISESEII